MKKQLSLTEQIQHSTCLIKTDVGQGTGFIYTLASNEETIIPLLVTNRHVIDGMNEASFAITKSDTDGNPIFGELFYGHSERKDWICHPNKDIDLAVLPVANIFHQATEAGAAPFFVSLSENDIADENYLAEMDAVENIIMVGYPTGVYDAKNNLPVTRRGITASRIGLQYNGKPEFLIDCACFPGSSGSPVFQLDSGPRITREGNTHLGGFRFKFLGILYGGPLYDIKGDIIAVPITTAVKPVASIPAMTNLGFCVRATELLEFKKQFQSQIISLNK